MYPQTRTDVVLGADAAPRSIVIAPADDYLPASAFHFDGTRLVVHYGGHDVVARLGSTDVHDRPAEVRRTTQPRR